MTENVYGINSAGELAWRIQKISDAYPQFKNTGNLYTVITERANDIMTVVSFEDEVFIVDPCTGEIMVIEAGGDFTNQKLFERMLCL
jgi:hypothetical protein